MARSLTGETFRPVRVCQCGDAFVIRDTHRMVRALRVRHLQIDVRIEAVAVEQVGTPVFAGLGDEGIDLVLRFGRG